ncbi:hypothetical protein [Luteimonas arsenica]|uniref:hypothetical protein n=1 Tax=Luteimonas arsenica TaxID=1586242 RepID=UPI0010566412|nr:hypothetical protein [Luteimonas arsenica]
MALKHWFEYDSDWRLAPMAYWVHIEQEGKHWLQADTFLPAPPRKITGKGYPVLCVEVRDVVLRFSSPAQLCAFIETLSLRPLPSTRRLSDCRGTGHGPNSHWLSRLPAWMKQSGFRDKTLPKIAALERQVADEGRSVGWG